MTVSAKSFTEIVLKLECGESAGPLRMGVECFKFFNAKLYVLLSLFLYVSFLWLITSCSTILQLHLLPLHEHQSGFNQFHH